ncbi:protein CFAP276-like [Babylonia areolata]|uniref:protein CFAP276-like n=1 Tax=Babylonia areolata TaxID=304850 RepID=UPI003FD0A8EB
MALMSTRNPYPFPKLENDYDFSGNVPQQVAPKTNSWTIIKKSNEVYGVPTHLAQQQDPWNRLNSKHTLSSSRHEVYHFDPKAPRDDLDFNLTAKYNHDTALFENRNQTVFQRETFDADCRGRKLKNREVITPKKPPSLNHPLNITKQKKMDSMFSVKSAVESHHTQSTNKGYSRKPDGGFFTS